MTPLSCDKPKRRPPLEVRTTVSIERGDYNALAEIAYERRVSIGCVMREAVAIFLGRGVVKAPKLVQRGKERGKK